MRTVTLPFKLIIFCLNPVKAYIDTMSLGTFPVLAHAHTNTNWALEKSLSPALRPPGHLSDLRLLISLMGPFSCSYHTTEGAGANSNSK